LADASISVGLRQPISWESLPKALLLKGAGVQDNAKTDRRPKGPHSPGRRLVNAFREDRVAKLRRYYESMRTKVLLQMMTVAAVAYG
jgi:hypothetical protein